MKNGDENRFSISKNCGFEHKTGHLWRSLKDESTTTRIETVTDVARKAI